MIDVMLVLLIIFMIVTPAITAGFQASIPRALNPIKKEEQDGEIRLGIDKDGKFFIDVNGADGKYTGMRFINDADLQTRLTAIFAARTSDKILFLKADANIPYSRVQDAIAIARKAGVRMIGAIADQQRVARPEELDAHPAP